MCMNSFIVGWLPLYLSVLWIQMASVASESFQLPVELIQTVAEEYTQTPPNWADQMISTFEVAGSVWLAFSQSSKTTDTF